MYISEQFMPDEFMSWATLIVSHGLYCADELMNVRFNRRIQWVIL